MGCVFYIKWFFFRRMNRCLFNHICLSNRKIRYEEHEDPDGDHQFAKVPTDKMMLEHFEEITNQVLYELSLRNLATLTID